MRRSAAPTSQQKIVQGHSTGVDLSPFLYHVVGCVVFTDPHRQILVYVADDMRGLGVLIMMLMKCRTVVICDDDVKYTCHTQWGRKHIIIGGGGRIVVSAVRGKTCIFFIQEDKILLGGYAPHPDYWGVVAPLPLLPAPMAIPVPYHNKF